MTDKIVEPEVDLTAVKVDELVDKWVFDNINNSPISRFTEAWNHLHTVLPKLKAAIKEAF